MNKTIKAFLSIVIYLYLPSIIALPLLFKEYNFSDTTKSTILLITQIITTIVIIIMFKKDLKSDFTNFKKNYKEQLSVSLKYYIVGFILMMLFNSIIALYGTSDISINEEQNRQLLETLMIYAIPTMTILGPICEEITFRKSFHQSFNKKSVYVLFTGLLFGLCHVILNGFAISNLVYILPYGALGIAFSYIYIRNNNIFPCIAYHIFHNTFTVLLLLSVGM